MTRLELLQEVVDTFKQAVNDRNVASFALLTADNDVERAAAGRRYRALCERVELLKRRVVDVAAGRAS